MLYEGLQKPPERDNAKSDVSYQSNLEQREKARVKMREMVETLNLSYPQAQELLAKSYRGEDGSSEYRGTSNKFDDSYLYKVQELGKIYNMSNPITTFYEWYSRWISENPVPQPSK